MLAFDQLGVDVEDANSVEDDSLPSIPTPSHPK